MIKEDKEKVRTAISRLINAAEALELTAWAEYDKGKWDDVTVIQDMYDALYVIRKMRPSLRAYKLVDETI